MNKVKIERELFCWYKITKDSPIEWGSETIVKELHTYWRSQSFIKPIEEETIPNGIYFFYPKGVMGEVNNLSAGIVSLYQEMDSSNRLFVLKGYSSISRLLKIDTRSQYSLDDEDDDDGNDSVVGSVNELRKLHSTDRMSKRFFSIEEFLNDHYMASSIGELRTIKEANTKRVDFLREDDDD
jgi:hypothetical protein